LTSLQVSGLNRNFQLARRPRHGGNLVWAAGIAQCDAADLLDFSASINPLGLPPSALDAIATNLGALIAYPDPGYGTLRTAIAAHHGISADRILPGNGAAELLTYAARLLASCDRVWMQRPAFADYDRALRAAGVGETQTLAIGQSDFGPGDGVLLNNPHNPSGQLIEPDWIRSVAESGATVVVDEAFMDFLEAGDRWSVVRLVETFPRLVVIRSLTKFYAMPGLRLGYGIAQEGVLRDWRQWRDPWSVNSLAAAVGAVVLSDREFQRRTWDWLLEAKPLLVSGLRSLPGLELDVGAANFLLVKSERSALEIQTELLKRHRIFVRDCMSFAELGESYFRIAVRTVEENQRLLDGLGEVLGR
jgi:L-threonine-O-3-phosphate decarboxylase